LFCGETPLSEPVLERRLETRVPQTYAVFVIPSSSFGAVAWSDVQSFLLRFFTRFQQVFHRFGLEFDVVVRHELGRETGLIMEFLDLGFVGEMQTGGGITFLSATNTAPYSSKIRRATDLTADRRCPL
jgi:hypothetical protein